MSAHLCSPYHIGRIAQRMSEPTRQRAYLKYHLKEDFEGSRLAREIEKGSNIGTDFPAAVATILAEANVRSLDARYEDSGGAADFLQDGETVTDYIAACASEARRYQDHYTTHDPYDMLEAIRSLSYQSCEFTDWKESTAYSFLVYATDSLVSELLERRDTNGWNLQDPTPEGVEVISVTDLLSR